MLTYSNYGERRLLNFLPLQDLDLFLFKNDILPSGGAVLSWTPQGALWAMEQWKDSPPSEPEYVMGLFQNDVTPTPALTLTDLVECDFPGYAGGGSQPGTAPFINGAGQAERALEQLSWLHLGGAPDQNVFGWYLKGLSQGEALEGQVFCAERFPDAPRLASFGGDPISIFPRFVQFTDSAGEPLTWGDIQECDYNGYQSQSQVEYSPADINPAGHAQRSAQTRTFLHGGSGPSQAVYGYGLVLRGAPDVLICLKRLPSAPFTLSAGGLPLNVFMAVHLRTNE